MAFLTPSKEEEILDELKSLAQLLGLEVTDSARFPTVMVRVAVDGHSSSITKQGDAFFASEVLPDVPMTPAGTGLFSYRLEI
jgi:hypothetical protein